jgi:chromosome partitioning protein
VTRSIATRRPAAVGWPEPAPFPDGSRSGSAATRSGAGGADPSSSGLGWSGLGWPGGTRRAADDVGVAELQSEAPDENEAATGSAAGEAGDVEPGVEQEDAVTPNAVNQSGDEAAATAAEAPPLEVSQKRIRNVLEDAVVSRETTAAPPAEMEIDTPIMREAAQAVRVLNPARTSAFPRPVRRRVITVANQKGGVGKTTSTVNLAVAFALHGLRVLVIDLDPQGNASTGLGVNHSVGVPSSYEVLVEGASLAEIELVSVVARETRLRTAISAYHDDVDYIFVDCPPSLGLLTVNALVAGDEVFIPIQCEYYALEGLGQLLRNIELIQAHLNDRLRLSTILLTMYDGRTKLADQVAQEVRNHFGDLVLDVVIPRSVRVSEAPGYGLSVMTYDPGSRGALTYLDAAREVAERGAAGGDPASGSGTEESA